MLLANIPLLKVLVFLSFFLHGIAVYRLIDCILIRPKYKQYAHIIMAFVYATLGVFAVNFMATQPDLVYVVLLVFLTLDFMLRYIYPNFLSILMCSFAVALHVMASFAISLSIFSLATQLPYAMLLNSSYIYLIISINMLFLCGCTVFVRRVIPPKYYELICRNREQISFLIILLGIFVFYMAVNTIFFSYETVSISLLVNEIIISLVMLFGTYLGLFFLIRINLLQEYKEKSETLEQEQARDKQYKEMILSDTLISYELNCNQNKLYKLSEGGKECFIGEHKLSYSAIMDDLIENKIYHEDKKLFAETMMPEHLIKAHQQGQDEIVLEYRRRRDNHDFGWVRTIITTAQDAQTGDITAVVLVKDIDVEKQNQINLQHRAERDSLTGAYNKAMVQKSISNSLEEDSQGVLLILDVDDFKHVNDEMGHLYGDAVLCKLVKIVKTTFRGEDLVGRVGGDEFIIFMRNNTLEPTVLQKADSLCKKIDSTSMWDGKSACHVSCSVGIAIAPQHGIHFDHLYHHADIALYSAKNKGKNTYSLYQGKNKTQMGTKHTSIDSDARP